MVGLIHEYTCAYTYICMCVCMYIYVYIYIYIYMYEFSTCSHACSIPGHSLGLHFMHKPTNVRMDKFIISSTNVCVCMYVCMYINIEHMNTIARTRTHMHIHAYAEAQPKHRLRIHTPLLPRLAQRAPRKIHSPQGVACTHSHTCLRNKHYGVFSVFVLDTRVCVSVESVLLYS